jgi:hypothetical protein
MDGHGLRVLEGKDKDFKIRLCRKREAVVSMWAPIPAVRYRPFMPHRAVSQVQELLPAEAGTLQARSLCPGHQQQAGPFRALPLPSGAQVKD